MFVRGMANPAELWGLIKSRPRLFGRLSTGEVGALLEKSLFTWDKDGGGGKPSRSNRSIPSLGTVRGSE